MGTKELTRIVVLACVAAGMLQLKQAAKLLEVSYRQAKRLYKKYQEAGPASLKHGNAGQRSNRAKPAIVRQKALELVKQQHTTDGGERFGPTLAEQLAIQNGLHVDRETLRRWMLEAGLWSQTRKHQSSLQTSDRKPHFGELVKLSGIVHPRVGNAGFGQCLMELVDDATGTMLMRLGRQETIWVASRILRAWLERYGIPRAIHVGWMHIYMQKASNRDWPREALPVTQFGRMCAALGIQILTSGVPQGEEQGVTAQHDQLFEQIRSRGLTNDDAVNAFLEGDYTPAHNQQFAVLPAAREDFHRRLSASPDLDTVFRLVEERTINDDWTVRYRDRSFQVQRASAYPPAQKKVVIYEWPDNRLEIQYRGRPVKWREVPEPAEGTFLLCESGDISNEHQPRIPR